MNFDESQKKMNSKETKQPQDLGQKVTEEWDKFTKTTHDVKKEIEDTINSVVEEIKDAGAVQRARDKRGRFVKESKKHPRVVLCCFVLGGSAIILALAYGIMKMIC